MIAAYKRESIVRINYNLVATKPLTGNLEQFKIFTNLFRIDYFCILRKPSVEYNMKTSIIQSSTRIVQIEPP